MKTKGPWDLDAIYAHLDQTVIPIRLSCTRARGFPLVASHWFMRRGSTIWCAVHERSAMAKTIRGDQRCGFEVSADQPPYFGVRGAATAELVPEQGREILAALIERYLDASDTALADWLLSRANEEVGIRLTPIEFFSWDYRHRMATAQSGQPT